MLVAPGAILDALCPASCVACDAPVASTMTFCAECERSIVQVPPHLPRWSAGLFGGALAQAIRRAKFPGDASIADALARYWIDRFEHSVCGPVPPVDGVAFVPAPYRRRVVRGFDLPAVLARAIAKHARVDVVDALKCERHDAEHSFGANREQRQTIVKGRFRARARFEKKTLLLVDDVKTTGATLAEAKATLEGAGATVIEAPFTIAP